MNAIMAKAKDVVRQAALPLWLVLCLLLGGASSAGIVANAILQITGISIILFIAWRTMTTVNGQREWIDLRTRQGQSIGAILLLAALVAAWVVVQMIPLPAAIWHSLGGRAIIIEGDTLLGVSGVSRPMSMQPNATLVSGGWLIVPLATFLLTLGTSEPVRRLGGYAVIGIAIMSSVLGVAQIGQGPNSPAYFYDITNFGTSVGFFANSNHLATLYLCALAMCPWLFFDEDTSSRKRKRMALDTLGVAVAAILVLNIAINRSVAGYILVIPLIAYVLLQHPAGRQAVSRLPFSMRTFLIGLAALTIAVGWLMFDILRDFSVGLTDPDTRLAYYSQTLAIARTALPFGIGLGAFRWVFTGYENPAIVDQTYVNHVHNDYIELLAEGGVIAVAFIAAFAVWAIRRLRRIHSLAEYQIAISWASAVVIGVIAAHSIVDYPARTAAIAALAAFAIANLAAPPRRR